MPPGNKSNRKELVAAFRFAIVGMEATAMKPAAIGRQSTPLLLALLLAGCAATTPSGAPLVPRVDRVYLFITPKEVRDETAYPPGQTTQKLLWEGKQFGWQITFPPRQHGYAGLQMKYPVDLAPVMDHGDLLFALSPAAAATNLSVALVDGTNRVGRVMVLAPVRATAVPFNPEMASVRIPLATFPATGIPLDDPDAVTGLQPFDAADLREIRFLAPQGVRGGPIVIRHLRVEH